MDKSPTLITSDLPRLLANHGFDQDSNYYNGLEAVREHAFQYLTSFATESVLEDALSIVKANEHYKVNSLFFVASPIVPSPMILLANSNVSWQL